MVPRVWHGTFLRVNSLHKLPSNRISKQQMATIRLAPDNVDTHIRWIRWVERDEIIGRVIRDWNGCCRIAPEGPHWSPMKGFADWCFESPEQALAEVELYFQGR